MEQYIFASTFFNDMEHVIKVRTFAPLLFGKHYQADHNCVQVLFQKKLIPTMCQGNEPYQEILTSGHNFHHYLACFEIFDQTIKHVMNSVHTGQLSKHLYALYDVGPDELHKVIEMTQTEAISPLFKKLISDDPNKLTWEEDIRSSVLEKLEKDQLQLSLDDDKISDTVLFFIRQFYSDNFHTTRLLEFCQQCQQQNEATMEQKNAGNLLFKNLDYKGAVEAYSKALDQSPFSSVLYSNRAQTYLKLSNSRAALWDSIRAIVLDPSGYKSYYRYAQACLDLQWTTKAIHFLRDAVIKFPKKEIVDQLKSLTDCSDLPELISSDEEEKPRKSHKKSQAKTLVKKENDKAKDEESRIISVERVNKLVEKRQEEMKKSSDATKQKYDEKQKKKALKHAAAAKENKKDEAQDALKPTSKDVSVQSRLMDFLRLGSEALLSIQYDEALRCYEEANDIIATHTLRYFNPTKFRELDYVVMKYALGHAEILNGSNFELLNSVRNFKEIIKNHPSVPFPLAYYGLGRAYKHLKWFPEGKEWVCKGLEFLSSKPKWNEYKWPGVHVIIEESKTEKLVALLREFEQYFRNPPEPDAMCKFRGCHQLHHKVQIYYSDPDFKGLVKLKCHEKCVIAYHTECWKKYKKDNLATTDKDTLSSQCFTPDCYGKITVIELYDEKADCVKELKASLDAIPPKVLKKKPPRQEKSSLAAIMKKQERRERKKQIKKEQKEQRRVEELGKQAAVPEEESASTDTEVVQSTAQVLSEESCATDGKTSISRVKTPVTEMEDVTVLRRTDNFLPLQAETKAKGKGKKKNNRGNKTTLNINPERLRDKHDVVSSEDVQEWKPKYVTERVASCESSGSGSADLNFSKPNDVQVNDVMREVQNVEPQFQNPAVAKRDEILSAFCYLLRQNGPLSPDDPLLKAFVSSLKLDWQQYIDCFKDIKQFLIEDTRFAFLNGYICLKEDAMRASKMPPANSYKGATGEVSDDYTKPPEAQLSQFVQHQLENRPPANKRKTAQNVDLKTDPTNAGEKSTNRKQKPAEKVVSKEEKTKTENTGDTSPNSPFDLDQFLTKGPKGVSKKTCRELKLDNIGANLKSNDTSSILGTFGGFQPKKMQDTAKTASTFPGLFNSSRQTLSFADASVDNGTHSAALFSIAVPKADNIFTSTETVLKSPSRFDDGSSVVSESSSKTDSRDILRSMFDDSGSESPAALRNGLRMTPVVSERMPSVSLSSIGLDAIGQTHVLQTEVEDPGIGNKSTHSDEASSSSISMGSLSSFDPQENENKSSRGSSSDVSDVEPTDHWDSAPEHTNDTSNPLELEQSVPSDWSFMGDQAQAASPYQDDFGNILHPPQKTTNISATNSDPFYRKDSFSEGEEFDSATGTRFGPIGSRSGLAAGDSDFSAYSSVPLQPLNTFPSAHDDSLLFNIPQFSASLSKPTPPPQPEMGVPCVSQSALFWGGRSNFEFSPSYNFASNPAAQINPNQSIWGPPVLPSNNVTMPSQFNPPANGTYGFPGEMSKGFTKSNAMMEHYQDILDQEACLEKERKSKIINIEAASGPVGGLSSKTNSSNPTQEEQMNAFEEVSRRWTKAETELNEAMEKLKLRDVEKENLQIELQKKDDEVMRMQNTEMRLGQELQELHIVLAQARGLHTESVHMNQQLQGALQEKDQNLKDLTERCSHVQEEHEKCEQEKQEALQKLDNAKGLAKRVQTDMLNIYQDLEVFKIDKKTADIQFHLKYLNNVRKRFEDNGRQGPDMSSGIREMELFVQKMAQCRGEFIGQISQLREKVAGGNDLDGPLPKPNVPSLPPLPPPPPQFIPFPHPSAMRGMSPAEAAVAARAGTPGLPPNTNQRSMSPNCRPQAPQNGEGSRMPSVGRGRSVVQGGPFVGVKPPGIPTSMPGAQPSKNKKHQFEKVIEKIQTIFPNHSRTDIIKVVQDFRQTRGATLSGILIDDIVNQVAICLMEKRAPAWEPLPPANPQRANSEVFEEEENSCIICFESMEAVSMTQLDCGHKFHKECIKKWFQEQSTCPNCRSHALLPEDFPALK